MMSQNQIPKIIHYCWFGGNPLPEITKLCIESWRTLLPDYEIVCWDEQNFDVSLIPFVQEAYEAKKWAFVSDYARLFALYHYGGIYLDTDEEVVKSLDEFLGHSFFCGFENYDRISAGLLGSQKGHEWLRELMAYYENRSFLLPTGKYDMRANPLIISEFAEKRGFEKGNAYQVLDGDIHVYPMEYFCPTGYEREKRIVLENTYALHHYAGTWAKKKKKGFLRILGQGFSRGLREWLGEDRYFALKNTLGFKKGNTKENKKYRPK